MLNNIMTLKSGLEVTQDPSSRYHSKAGLKFLFALLADADEFIKLVARGLNRYNIIKRETYIQLKNITIRLTEKEHN